MGAYRKSRNSMFLPPSVTVAVIVLFLLAELSTPAMGAVAVSFDPPDDINNYAWPSIYSNHGWQFTVNQPLEVTHVGLFDHEGDGFEVDHPIGLWQSPDGSSNDFTLLATGTITTGTSNPLINHFRYIDIPAITLNPQHVYIIGFYTGVGIDTRAPDDAVVARLDELQVDPRINYMLGLYKVYSSGLEFPTNLTSDEYPYRFGPNFKFVPELATLVDFNRDGRVDFKDFSILAQYWLQDEPLVDIAPPPLGDQVVNFKDLAILARCWLRRIPPGRASNPHPWNGATNVDINYDLSWTAGVDATSHDVYFGTTDPPPFIWNQTAKTFDPGTMALSTTYYWRVDEVGAYGTTTGTVWRFTSGWGGPPP